MKAQIYVKKLNNKGIFISESFRIGDCDEELNSNINPDKKERIIVCPIEDEIKYMKVSKGYLVSGEGYIVDDDKEEIAEVKKRLGTFDSVTYTEVYTKDNLF